MLKLCIFGYFVLAAQADKDRGHAKPSHEHDLFWFSEEPQDAGSFYRCQNRGPDRMPGLPKSQHPRVAEHPQDHLAFLSSCVQLRTADRCWVCQEPSVVINPQPLLNWESSPLTYFCPGPLHKSTMLSGPVSSSSFFFLKGSDSNCTGQYRS